MYYLETGHAIDTRFRNAMLVAVVAHVVLVLAVSFNASLSRPSPSPQIEVTLATRPTDMVPTDANLLAQANQAGGGNEAQQNQLSTRNPLQSDSVSDQQERMPLQQEQSVLQHEAITTTGVAVRRVTTEQTEETEQQASLDGVSNEVDRINREIASLQAELDEENRFDAAQPRVRRLTAASAKQSADAAYLLDWRKRLEAVGNQYYPQASIRYGLYGELRMLVVIRNDGSLEDIKILSSSGYAVLDEAAIKIVRMAAPYAPFPAELRATTDKLEIVRTWHFQENQLSSP